MLWMSASNVLKTFLKNKCQCRVYINLLFSIRTNQPEARKDTLLIHDFANVTLAMPDGFDRVAPSPSWGHRVVSNNKQKFNNEVECKMCSK